MACFSNLFFIRKSAYRSIINPDWDFQKMGIGGLDKEFSGIFRRAFASRVFPPEFIEQLGQNVNTFLYISNFMRSRFNILMTIVLRSYI